MTAQQILFILIAVVTLGSAFLVVTGRNLIHAALWLIVVLFGVAVFFAMLNASFLAVAQVVVYIGAIAVLMIFAVMLTRRINKDTGRQINPGWPLGALVSLFLFGGLGWMLTSWSGFSTQAPAFGAGIDPLQNLGQALVAPNQYVLPLELASVLLLAAMVGAIMIAWEKKS